MNGCTLHLDSPSLILYPYQEWVADCKLYKLRLRVFYRGLRENSRQRQDCI